METGYCEIHANNEMKLQFTVTDLVIKNIQETMCNNYKKHY